MFKWKSVGILLGVSFMVVSVVSAAGLANPMRPPAGFNGSSKKLSPRPQKQADWHLQSVILGKERAVALIDGVAVRVGGRYQGIRLIEVRSDAVVLREDKGKEIVLKLVPGVQKKWLPASAEKILK